MPSARKGSIKVVRLATWPLVSGAGLQPGSFWRITTVPSHLVQWPRVRLRTQARVGPELDLLTVIWL